MVQVQFPNTYTPAAPRPINDRSMTRTDWTGEISGMPETAGMQTSGMQTAAGMQTVDGMQGAPGMQGQAYAPSGAQNSLAMRDSRARGPLEMSTGLPRETIDSPITLDEARAGSLKTMLGKNLGAFVSATFLMGTQGTVTWDGILYDVGNDFMTIYQEGRDRYIVSDIYSLKYIEFYDTRRREMCDQMMGSLSMENGLPNGQ